MQSQGALQLPQKNIKTWVFRSTRPSHLRCLYKHRTHGTAQPR